MAQIFLCYAREDEARVRNVYRRLRALGFELWMDKITLIPGQRWQQEIPRALRTSDFVLIFFLKNSVGKRGYVQREFKLALDTLQEVPDDVIHTIPVRLDNCDLPEQFGFLQWCDLFERGGFQRLVRAIRAGVSQRPEPAVRLAESTTPAAEQSGVLTLSPRLTNSIGMGFVLIPAGPFMMGSPDADSEALDLEKPAHQVTISQPFYLGKYPVTQAQWEAVIGTNPSQFTGDPNCSVERVSWEDVQEFIRGLNAKEGDAIYRLPTEAEWEYAARAGSTTAYSFGDDPRQLDEYGRYRDNSGDQTHPVGQRKPNAWGLYDMHGNVWEWVQDWYGAYAPEPVTDPRGPSSGSSRVFRGGSWGTGAGRCRSAFRGSGAPGDRGSDLGFRLLRTAP
jgi:formylglycine-generating enzyme required for sulfatase activity